MIKNDKILFQSGRILNAKMLDRLQEFTLRNFEIRYSNYSDGIITGLDFLNNEKKLYLTPGVLKHKGEYYFLEKQIEIFEFKKSGEKKYIYLKIKEQSEKNNIETNSFEIVIASNLPEEEYIYLGEFEHHENSVKTQYEKIEDLTNDCYMDIRKRKYAGEFESTISPTLLYLFAKEKQNHMPLSYLEAMIISNGLNKKTVSFDILKEYLGENLSFENYYELLKDKTAEIRRVERVEIVKSEIEEEVEEKKVERKGFQGFR